MRLAVFTSQFPSRVNTFFARDMRALIAAGWQIDVFPIYPADAELWQYVPDILDEKVLPRNRVHHGTLANDIRCLLAGAGRRSGRLLRDLAAVLGSAARFGLGPTAKSAYAVMRGAAWAQTHAGPYDHILAYWGNYAATSAYVFQRLSAPSTPFSMFLHAGTDLYRQQVFLPQKLLYADNIIVVCEFNRNFLETTYPKIFHRIADKIHLYHLGLNLEEFAYRPAGRPEQKLIAVGRLDRSKGFDVLLRAVGELARRGLSVEVDLVGDGPALRELQGLADTLGIAHQVRFHGWLPFEQVRERMARATVLVHPSVGLGDAVPTVIKECMAIGTPVIGSAIAGIPELLDQGRCGVIVPPQDFHSLAEAIEDMLIDHPRRQQYARAGRDFAERQFDVWANGRRLSELLRRTRRRDAPQLVAPETLPVPDLTVEPASKP